MSSQKYQQIRRQLARAYDESAADRDRRPGLPPWKKRVRAAFLADLQREGLTTLLEIGSGPGRDGLYFQEAGLVVLCTDNSPEMVRLCRAKGLHAEERDFFNLDFPSRSFDAVFAMNSLLHVPKSDLPTVLSRLHALLRPGGLFFFGVYGGRDMEGVWAEDSHEPKRFFSYFSDERLLAVIAPWFEVLRFETIPQPERGEFHFQALTLRPKK